MSVMAETSQSAMGPYSAMAAVGSALYAWTAVCREALVVKVYAGLGLGGDGGGEVGGEAIVTAGFSSIVMPGAVEAAAAVPRVEASEVCTAAAVVEAGTVMVTMMSTLPAVTAMVTSDLSTPAVVATPCRKF